jgi:hypothetical protein
VEPARPKDDPLDVFKLGARADPANDSLESGASCTKFLSNGGLNQTRDLKAD